MAQFRSLVGQISRIEMPPPMIPLIRMDNEDPPLLTEWLQLHTGAFKEFLTTLRRKAPGDLRVPGATHFWKWLHVHIGTVVHLEPLTFGHTAKQPSEPNQCTDKSVAHSLRKCQRITHSANGSGPKGRDQGRRTLGPDPGPRCGGLGPGPWALIHLLSEWLCATF